jgi:hypothetical protein
LGSKDAPFAFRSLIKGAAFSSEKVRLGARSSKPLSLLKFEAGPVKEKKDASEVVGGDAASKRCPKEEGKRRLEKK